MIYFTIMEGKSKPYNYNFKEREHYWKKYWEEKGITKFDPDSKKPIFSIDTPPPTVSGKLHLGHVFSYTHAEVIARYHRMKGENLFFPIGLDNNGLPTEVLFEREKNISAKELGAEKFTALVKGSLPQFENAYLNLFNSLGFSYDYSLLYKTNSKEVEQLVQKTFLDFKENGIAYKKKEPALYCWKCMTSVAQAEVEDRSVEAIFYDIAFKKEDGSELVIATTRPELLPAIVAVFVNPTDTRYKGLAGQSVVTPLGDKVPVLEEETVEVEKGTGAVMVCSYGDETDLVWIKKHNLPEKIIFDESGSLTRKVLSRLSVIPDVAQGDSPGSIDRANDGSRIKCGMTNINIYDQNRVSLPEFRSIIVNLLKQENAIKSEAPITHDVAVHERCGTPIEIFPREQWFVKSLDYKKQVLEAGRKIKWYPKFMQKRFEDWVGNLKWDWCISRERYYGIPIPGEDKLYFDTWFTSSQTPEILGCSLPMSFRPQAHDIIRTWATYTILMGVLKHTGQIPWKSIMISGHILAKKGAKISKRTGGGAYSPEDIVAEYGADVVRYSMCTAALGKDAFFEEEELAQGKRLITKLINVSRFIKMHTQGFNSSLADISKQPVDSWILSRSEETAAAMASEFEKFEFAKPRILFEQFFWSIFCDNYLEIIKKRLYEGSEEEKAAAKKTLLLVFENVLKMLAPFMPFISEELYHEVFGEDKKSIHIALWPKSGEKLPKELEKGAELLMQLISLMRKEKNAKGLSLGAEVEKITLHLTKEEQLLFEIFSQDFKNVSRIEELEIKAAGESLKQLTINN